MTDTRRGVRVKRYVTAVHACLALALLGGLAACGSSPCEKDVTPTTTNTRPPTTARPSSTTSPDQAEVDAVEQSFRSYAGGSDLLENVTSFESFAGGNGVQIDTNLHPDADARALSSRWCGLAVTWLATYGDRFGVIGIRVATSDGQRVALSRGTSGCEQANF